MFQSIIDPRRRNGKIAPVVVGLESRTRRKSMGVSTITVSDTGESAPGARSTVRRCVLCSSTLHAAAPHCSDGGSDRSAAAGQPPSLRRAWRSSPSVYGAPARDGRCPAGSTAECTAVLCRASATTLTKPRGRPRRSSRTALRCRSVLHQIGTGPQEHAGRDGGARAC
jgi:hypothetical protein